MRIPVLRVTLMFTILGYLIALGLCRKLIGFQKRVPKTRPKAGSVQLLHGGKSAKPPPSDLEAMVEAIQNKTERDWGITRFTMGAVAA